ncbi:unnamed protein product [Brachionus calyciflorus]|uniref:N-acetylgalactosaminide beta-1,3-galactosyltransferase n=1 Tax=Brachionus calyciflorus TaxID=104777 RepID=A0A814C7N0_9BILA|nr:unnamed protein product [Brachionus calyciflorus]
MLFKLKISYLIWIIFTCLLVNLIISNSKSKNFSLNNLKSFLEIYKPIRPKTLFCLILTTEKNLDTKTLVIYKTWAKKCDNFKFFTIKPKHDLEGNYWNSIVQPPGLSNDSYKNLTNKVYLSIKYVYNMYPDYDWYLKADDDTFIFVDNLKDFVFDKNSSTPVTYGYDFKSYVENGYHSGGAGYLISNEAFRRIGSKLNENFTYCPDTGVEDLDIGKCFRKLGVYPNKSIDDLGRERFHILGVLDHYNGIYPQWVYEMSSNQVQKGFDCCSDNSISFHYMSQKEIIVSNNILTNMAQNFSFKHFLDKYLDRI